MSPVDHRRSSYQDHHYSALRPIWPVIRSGASPARKGALKKLASSATSSLIVLSCLGWVRALGSSSIALRAVGPGSGCRHQDPQCAPWPGSRCRRRESCGVVFGLAEGSSVGPFRGHVAELSGQLVAAFGIPGNGHFADLYQQVVVVLDEIVRKAENLYGL